MKKLGKMKKQTPVEPSTSDHLTIDYSKHEIKKIILLVFSEKAFYIKQYIR
jgi:hypothetical protein